MQQPLFNLSDESHVSTLSIVKAFKKIIEGRDISKITKELYEFFHLHCGFIAHYDINGFKATYSAPKDFADVFIRHFDRQHPYCSGIYRCHEEPYNDTGFTKAEILQEFFRIVESYKDEITRWAESKQRGERFALYQSLKKEFEKEV